MADCLARFPLAQLEHLVAVQESSFLGKVKEISRRRLANRNERKRGYLLLESLATATRWACEPADKLIADSRHHLWRKVRREAIS